MTPNHAGAPDQPTRRDALVRGGLGALALAALGRGTVLAQNMVLDDTPGLTVGPYWVDEGLNRMDVRSDPTTGAIQPGLPLSLTLNVAALAADGTTTPIAGAQVDLWQANGSGKYSDEASEGTSGVRYLRGYQLSNAYGNVQFLTIYPGWYPGRTPHIHIRVRVYDPATLTLAYNFTTQLFMDDAITDDVYANVAPYNARGTRDTTNARDGIFRGASADGTPAADAGSYTLMQLTEDRTRAVGSFNIILDLADAANASGSTPGGGGPSGGTPPAGGTPPGGIPKSGTPKSGTPKAGTPKKKKAAKSSGSSSSTKAGKKATQSN